MQSLITTSSTRRENSLTSSSVLAPVSLLQHMFSTLKKSVRPSWLGQDLCLPTTLKNLCVCYLITNFRYDMSDGSCYSSASSSQLYPFLSNHLVPIDHLRKRVRKSFRITFASLQPKLKSYLEPQISFHDLSHLCCSCSEYPC